jgi:hypothetical protein
MAYRVLWACENAPLRDQTIDSLARFYRLQPISKSTQSKYEYTLTRLLAGPIGPDRGLAPTEDLVDMVETLTASWDAPSFTGEEGEIATILSTLDSFARDATSQTDAATFTARALLRKFGSFKASIGEKIFDPRVGAAVVEANVAVLNALDRLLADAGGHLVKSMQAAMRAPRLLRAHRITAERRRPVFQEGQETPVADQADTDARVPDQVEAEASEAGPDVVRPPEEIQPDAGGSRPLTRIDFKTGEVDLSGLEYVFPYGRRKSFPSSDSGIESAARPEGPDPDDLSPESTPESTPEVPRGQGEDPTGEIGVGPDRNPEAAGSEVAGAAPKPFLPSPPSAPPKGDGVWPAPVPAVQQPSPRALDLGKAPENAAVIESYLASPRSAEVWQLDLDVFLGFSGAGILEAHAPERRRALELILLSDDLIVARTEQEGAPSTEHRSRVKSVANAMLLLRTAMRRAADAAKADLGALEPLLYVSDHLLWERLRLEASLKRNPRKQRSPGPPPRDEAAEAAQRRKRMLRRHRRILIRVVGVAALLTTLIALLGLALPRAPIDKEVRLIDLTGFPGAELFDEARAFKSTLFISANRTWTLLAEEERRSAVRALGAFAAERGLDTVSIIGSAGQPWATFKDDEVLLAVEPSGTDSPIR